ncbi:hypothetical protein [Aeromonas phage yong1]|uniref:Uncharacterized protein n=1 Tax=Aeromonas phage yong1 TaxID=2924882 RepID=A0A9X9H412_9CAUD|nr:hypothetical protein [Aeromonas phage yong1]
MSTGTALVNARTPSLAPDKQLGHGHVTYLSPEEQHERALAAALGPDHELDCVQPKNAQPGQKRRIVQKPAPLAAPYGEGLVEHAVASLVAYHNKEEIVKHLSHRDKEALLSALADSLGLAVE